MRLSIIRTPQDTDLVSKALDANAKVKGWSYAVLQTTAEGGDRAYLLEADQNDPNVRLLASAKAGSQITVAYQSDQGPAEVSGRLTHLRDVGIAETIFHNVAAPIAMVGSAVLGLITTIQPHQTLSALALGVIATVAGGFGTARYLLRAGNNDLAAAVVRGTTTSVANKAEVCRVETPSSPVAALPAPAPSELSAFALPVKVLERV